jgi:glycosyltransferase involved in cell wall biosynthesis
MVDALAARIQRHAERGKRLIWIEQASDEYLDQLYTRASCLIAASEGEGFGLPLIEAAKHSLPILATDLPVFREVAGEHALFFKGDAVSLAAAVAAWLELFRQQLHPRSDAMPHLTWRQSAAQFTEALLGVGDGVSHELMPQNTSPPSGDAFVRLAGSSHQK